MFNGLYICNDKGLDLGNNEKHCFGFESK